MCEKKNVLKALERNREQAFLDLKQEVCFVKGEGHLFLGEAPPMDLSLEFK